MTSTAQVVAEFAQIAGPCSNEPPPPPTTSPRQHWKCVQCSKEETPVKRSGPQGPGTLCNACGLRIRKKSRAVAAAGAAAAAAAAGLPHQRRARQKKRPPPRPKKVQVSKREDETPPPKKQRTVAAELSNTHRSPVPPPAVTLPLTAHSTVTVVPSQRVRAANPVSPSLAKRIVVPITSAAQPVHMSTVPRPAPSPAVPTVSAPPPSTTPAVVAPNPVAVVRTPSGALSVTPQDGAQGIPTEGIVASAVVKTATPPGSLSHPATPEGPPTSPEGVPLIQAQAPSDAVATLLLQSSQTEDSNADEILSALHMNHGAIEGGSAESANRTDQDSFPGITFARCDSSGTDSTQLNVIEVLEGIEGGSDDLPPGTCMVSAESPYWNKGNMAAPTASMTTPTVPMTPPAAPLAAAAVSMVTSEGSMAGAPPPSLMTGQPHLPVPLPSVVQPGEVARYMNELTALGRLNSGIVQRMFSIDEDIAAFARRHEELTVARNEVSLSISKLIGAKDTASKRQRQLYEEIARTTCILNYLQKQGRFVASA